MDVAEAARLAGIPPKTIRHSESIGLLKVRRRSEAGDPIYSDDDVHAMRFIKRACELGFSLQRIRDLLALWQDPARASADVKYLALLHLLELDRRIDALDTTRSVLQRLVDACAGDPRPDCPILTELESG